MIFLGTAGANLTIKAIAGSENERLDKKKILEEIKGFSKIPIYKRDTFLYFEIDKSALPIIYELWQDKEIVVDKRAQPVIDAYKFSLLPLKDLMDEEITEYPLNKDYEYNDIQEEICSISHKRKSMLIFLDTGAGKLLAALARMANLGFKKALVFSQLDNLPDWEEHIRIMWGTNKSYTIYDGTAAQRKKLNLDVDMILTNYEKMKEIKTLDIDYDCVVFDEFHCVTNPSSKGFKLADSISKKAEIRIGMTATPLEENIEPLWGAIHIVDSQLAGSKENFLDNFQEVVKWHEIKYQRGGRELTHRIPSIVKTKNLPELQRLLSTIAYRKDVSHNFKFEDKTKIIDIDITDKQRKLYDQVVDEILFELSARTFYTENPLQKTLRLLQACDGLYNFEIDNLESGKLDYIKAELDKSDEPIIVWSRFKNITEILGKMYPNDGVVYNGDTSKARKRLHKLAFQGCRDAESEREFYELLEKYPDFPIRKPGTASKFFATFSQRSGAGMNLPRARKQIAACIGESGRAFKQAMGRIKRFDSKHSILDTEILVTRGTIESKHCIKTLDKIAKAARLLDGKDSILNTKISEIISLIQHPMINELG